MNRILLMAVFLLMILPGCETTDEPQTTVPIALQAQQNDQADEDVMDNLRGQKSGGDDLPGLTNHFR